MNGIGLRRRIEGELVGRENGEVYVSRREERAERNGKRIEVEVRVEEERVGKSGMCREVENLMTGRIRAC